MRAVWKPVALVAVMAMAVCAYAAPYTITSLTYTESYPAVVTWDSTHVYVNWQGLPFNIFDYVDITLNGGSGLSGVPGSVTYNYPTVTTIFNQGGGPFYFTVPAVVGTETQYGPPIVVNVLVDAGINIGYTISSSWSSAPFNGEVFTLGSTPEPGSIALLGTGLLAVAGVLRRKLRL